MQTQAGLGHSSWSEWLQSLPQLFGDEGHEGREQSKRQRHTVIENSAGHLRRVAAVVFVCQDLNSLILLQQHWLYIFLQDRNTEMTKITLSF